MKKLEVIILKETEKAVLCTSPYITENESYKNPAGTQYSFWLPKSQIKLSKKNMFQDSLERGLVGEDSTMDRKLVIIICELPEWLLMKI